ncbi:MAG: hypothetical protein A3C02_00510 [Candidatus Andersenbacteria bacterium RIFCSPHIGHO2_02_FULL_45_11]|uniref:CDP-diacylglycerol--glycerol-3-phosphate 3-phosphatidyltransferase n=1 Tax=Candidatus Andersenbacteria bacterium RIFCSPHIGHO2_12_FULL_45_11 TaxID=1797281 RepID=A0A1G1X4B1_9BACT|nr:MAG: hypothetical protein A2805_03970 [Candidatus Andersenbacteria bacterium RIFCSPHIGHO2_01_FULL_46_36]OGY33698.1 MAG: hypothetical protein A3C02_00510 [Candidatus Andersenbacteria bacterium RIFCSPHIGHO2_02_FULL_45_11]OGY34856.1 MAG: hypothetical protein A3D99_03035 [Candidatus Andersenbacteria bacterium RIFCSPHIGHO2_12_FULL_45_11]
MRTWIANAVTVSRLGFFAACIWFLGTGRPGVAILFFVVAWGLDAIDGAIARRLGQATILGSQLDKAIDRIIIIGSVVFLLRYEYLPTMAVFLLVKDVGLSIALSVKPTSKPFPSAGNLGKITSLLQGAGILWLFFGLPGQVAIVTGIGLLGGYVAVDYLRKL